MTIPIRDTLIPAEANRAMFDDIAVDYDRMNQLMSLGQHRGWRRRAIKALAPSATGTYLEIGSGTGDLIIELLRQQPQARVLGVDPSNNMNAIAQHKLEARNLADRVTLHTADFMQFNSPVGPVDGIISAFCIRNLEHLDEALARMHGMTRPGGRVLALELTRPDSAFLRVLCKTYNRTVIPFLAIMCKNGAAYKYLADSIDHFPSPDAVRQRFEKAGFKNVTLTPYTGGSVTLFSGTV